MLADTLLADTDDEEEEDVDDKEEEDVDDEEEDVDNKEEEINTRNCDELPESSQGAPR